jgi:diguanylate cyclase (GGDEF)-like protein
MNMKRLSKQLGIPVALYAVSTLLLLVLGTRILPEISRGPARTTAIVVLIILAMLLSGLFVYMVIRNLRGDKNEEQLKDKAQTDALTGLLNRAAALERISHFIYGEGREWRHALMIIDLDGFKEINDTFGHLEGDRVLQAMAKKMQSILRPSDIIGRFGGDEFIVLVKYTETIDFVRRHARELVYALEYLCVCNGIPKTVTASIGVALVQNGQKTFEQFFQEADEALYTAKLSGKNRYCIYGDEEQREGKADKLMGRSTPLAGEYGALIQLQTLIDNIDGGITLLEIGEEIRSIYHSYSFIRLMNLTSVAFGTAGRQLSAFVHPSDLPVVEATLRAGTQMDKAVEIVFRRMDHLDRTLWYHMRASRTKNDEGPYPTMLAIVTDVTRLKEAELTYRAYKRQLEMVIQISRIVTFEIDLRAQSIILSRDAAAKYQLQTTKFSTTKITDDLAFAMEMNYIHPESKEECQRLVNEILTGAPEGSAIIQLLRPDGQYTLERFSFFTVYDLSDRPSKVVVINEALDISDNSMLRLELIEKELREFSDNLVSATIVHPNSDSFHIVKEDPEYAKEEAACPTYTNLLHLRSGRCISEEQREELLETFSLQAFKRAATLRHILRGEYMVLGKDGSTHWLLVTASVFTDWYRGALVSSMRVRDITAQRQLCEELGVTLWFDKSNAFYDFDALRPCGFVHDELPADAGRIRFAAYEQDRAGGHRESEHDRSALCLLLLRL